jgi:N-acetylglutamate synthase
MLITEMPDIEITPFEISLYDDVLALWQCCDGVGLSDADSREDIQKYLERNPGMSFIASSSGKIVGAILAGHDGRRGYIHHLAVHPDFRKKGVARRLVDRSIAKLKDSGIRKCHLFVFNNNHAGLSFWQKIGWRRRLELSIVSRQTAEDRSQNPPPP